MQIKYKANKQLRTGQRVLEVRNRDTQVQLTTCQYILVLGSMMHNFQEIYKNLDDDFENKRYQRTERTWFSGF